MPGYDITADVSELRAAAAQHEQRIIPRAQARSLNDTLRTARKIGVQRTRLRRRLKARRIRNALKTERATIKRLRARIHAVGGRVPLKEYGARKTRRGVTVNISGQRQRWKSRTGEPAFIIDRYNGHVFARKGKARGPIEKQYGPSIPTGFANDQVHRALNAAVRQRFPVVFRRNFDFYRKRAPSVRQPGKR